MIHSSTLHKAFEQVYGTQVFAKQLRWPAQLATIKGHNYLVARCAFGNYVILCQDEQYEVYCNRHLLGIVDSIPNAKILAQNNLQQVLEQIIET